MGVRSRRPSRRVSGGIGIAITGALVLTACIAEEGGGSSGGGEGVPAGASQEEYREAFADVEPITLQAQTPGSPEATGGNGLENYAEVLDEWSGGKIELDIAYGDPIASGDEAPDALADGRLDLDYVYPLYEPSRYPANSALADVSFLGEHTPVAGSLQAMGGFVESAFDTPEIMEEMEDEGVKLLLPYGPTSSLGLVCDEPRSGLDEMEGAQVRVSGSAHAEQAEALGMSPISLSESEVFEALQRGTADCAMGTSWAYQTLGLLPLAPHNVIDPDTGFARLPFGIGFGQDQWESLPLVAQQLIHDKVGVYVKGMFVEHIWPSLQSAVEEMRDEDGSVSEFDADVRDRLDEVNEGLLDDVRSSDALDGEAFLAGVNESLDKWRNVVDELDYPDIGDDEFLDWYSEDKIDLDPFLERLTSEVLDKHRPE